MNIQTELTDLLETARAMLEEALDQPEKASGLVNACTTLIVNIGKVQKELYTAARLQRLEQILIEALETLPETTRKSFMEHYDELLSAAS